MTQAPADSQDPSPGERANPLRPVLFEVKRTIVGQDVLLERMAIALLCGGHLLVEGVPGLAKTLSVKSLAAAVGGQFQRIQFTPDLVPADLTGTRVYHQHSGEFQTQLGPVFTNLLLADEINRAPAKVQSALLEVMQEHQVTIGRETFQVPEPFLVMATQNPIESEGTYPLPEAQVDRFMMKVVVGYPTATEEHAIVDRALRPAAQIREMLTPADLITMQGRVSEVYVDPAVVDYAVRLVTATRHTFAAGLGDMKKYVSYGASPRASIALVTGARALAFLQGRDYVLPEDVSELGLDVLRHRIVLSYEALADDVTPDVIIAKVLDAVRRARRRPERPLSRCPRRRPRPRPCAPPRNGCCSASSGGCFAALRDEWRAVTVRRTAGREPTSPACAPTWKATTRGTSTGTSPPG